MYTRLQQFLKAENISQSQFADTIGVARASVSHILAGRNKPGFDFIDGMMSHYPALNIEWLITGKGKMYKTSENNKEDISLEPDLFSSFEPQPKPAAAIEAPSSVFSLPKESREKHIVELPSQKDRKISKIVVFYSDNTFAEIV